MTEPQRRILTAEHLYDLPLEDVRAELVRGDLICEPPAGIEHGIRTSKVGHHLERYIEEHPVGVVCGAGTGFVLFRNPDTVRAPDAAFISRERFERFVEKEKYFEGAPDLAAEVVSPGDSRREVEEKVRDYLEAGTRLVWVIDLRRRTVTVHRPGAEPDILGPDDHLDGGDLLPGFSLPVSRLVG
jgi:Uma2 family endonuclease